MAKKTPVHRNGKSESRCIICGEEKNGLEVEEDFVIRAIRYFKKNVTRNAKNYHLVVCKEDYMKFSKARDSYVKKQILYVVLGAVFAALLILYTWPNLGAIIYGLAIVILMYAISLLTYIPAVRLPKGAKQPAK